MHGCSDRDIRTKFFAERFQTFRLQIPLGLAMGMYRLGLWFPDGSARLQYDNRFAIRCANGDTQWWVSPDGKYGVNILMNKISVK